MSIIERFMVCEEWRPVVGWEGLYEVSSRGRVRSLDREMTSVRGNTFIRKGKLLTQSTSGKNVPVVGLSREAKSATTSVSRMVAEAFIPNPNGHPLVRHWDDNPRNNVVDNLVWGTYSENQYDRVRNGIYVNKEMLKTHCKNGHPLIEGNIYRVSSNPTWRRCRTCILASVKRSQEKKKGEK